MRRLYLYILLCTALLAACQQEQLSPTVGEAVLELDLQRLGRPMLTTRAVDDDLVVDILKDGTLYNDMHYAPGTVPSRIVLEPGNFVLRAYTDNQTTWAAANDGRGEAAYYAETSFTMEDDMVFRLKLDVPMTNYAVGLQLPDLFNNLFSAYTFTLQSGTRTVTITEGQKAYFSVADAGFSYALRATNIDGVAHAHSAIDFTDVEAGKCFTIRYSYDSSATSGGVDIVITDDMEPNDTNINL